MVAPPPVVYLGFLGLGFALEGLLPGAELPGWAQWIGAVVIVAGVALMISFELAFRRAGTDANPYRPSTALATDDPLPQGNAVEVLTFHRAKGLEWPVVFVTGLEDGFVPISHAATDAAAFSSNAAFEIHPRLAFASAASPLSACSSEAESFLGMKRSSWTSSSTSKRTCA